MLVLHQILRHTGEADRRDCPPVHPEKEVRPMENVRELNLEQMEKVSGGAEEDLGRLIWCHNCHEFHLERQPCRIKPEDVIRQREEEHSGQILVPRDGSPGPNIKPDIPLPDIPIPEINKPWR